MGIFDFFGRNKKNKNDDDITNDNFDKDEQLQGAAKKNNLLISTDGDILKKVYAHNIENGVFIVPNHIKTIAAYAFAGLKNLKKVVLHKNIKYIGPMAFSECENLVEVAGLEEAEIKSLSGFEYCTNLEKFSMPKSLYIISAGAFLDCKKLNNITIPNDCFLIDRIAFAGCENLQELIIPDSMEIINTSAFTMCKNLNIIFFEDNDKKYYEDLIAEMGISPETEGIAEKVDEEYQITDEERIQAYEDMGIKYKIINISGKDMIYMSKRINIKPDALTDVKSVVAFSEDMLSKILNSGYKGVVTFVDSSKEETYTVDFSKITDMLEQKKQRDREKKNNQYLIPPNGITNWFINCNVNGYKYNGYFGKPVFEHISDNWRIKVEDCYEYKKTDEVLLDEYREFFTSVTLFKNELEDSSSCAPHIYERAHIIYYPFGTRFDKTMLIKIAEALDLLIDNARELNNNALNRKQIELIIETEKKILDLFKNGTNDVEAVEKIMKGVKLKRLPSKPREVKTIKDYLPYFTNTLDENIEEFNKFIKESQKDNNENQKQN